MNIRELKQLIEYLNDDVEVYFGPDLDCLEGRILKGVRYYDNEGYIRDYFADFSKVEVKEEKIIGPIIVIR